MARTEIPGERVVSRDPPSGLSLNRDRLVRNERREVLDMIRVEAGRWALFASLGTPTSASNLAVRVRHGHYGPGFEATARKSDVYVRNVGDVSGARK